MKNISSLLANIVILSSVCPALAGWNHMNLGFTWSGDTPPTDEDYKHVLKGEIYDFQRGTDGKRFTYTGVYKTKGKYSPKDATEIRKSGAKNPTMAPDRSALFCSILSSHQSGKKNLLKKIYKFPVKISAAHFYVNRNASTFLPLPSFEIEEEVQHTFESEIITEEEPNGVNTEYKSTGSWIAIYRGKVVAPKDMTFRFLGAADDYLSVTFNGKQVLETGFYIPSYCKGNGERDAAYHLPAKKEYQDKINNGLELNHKDYILIKYKSTHQTNSFFGGLTGGTPITVKKGAVYPIEILVANEAGAYYFYLMTLEATQNNRSKPVLFRTSNQQVAHSSTFRYSHEGGPHYDNNGEDDVWRIVTDDANGKDSKKKKEVSPRKKFKKL